MIIITGVNGGIGNYLLKKLAKFDKVIGIYNKKKTKSNK